MEIVRRLEEYSAVVKLSRSFPGPCLSVIIVVVSVDLVVFYESIEPLLPEPDVLSDLRESKLARSA
jgi:hypothetical protein